MHFVSSYKSCNVAWKRRELLLKEKRGISLKIFAHLNRLVIGINVNTKETLRYISLARS